MKSVQAQRRRDLLSWVLVWLILFAGWGLRLYRLDRQSIWYDEAVSIQNSAAPLTAQTTLAAHDNHPPLHAFLLWLTERLSGTSAWSARFLSAWTGFLLLPLLYALARRWWGNPGGIAALFLAATSPLLVYYAQEARMYALITTLVAASFWSAARWWRGRPLGKSLWLTTFFVLAALYAHYSAFLVLPILYGVTLLRCWRDRQSGWWRALALSLSMLVIGYLPWALVPLQRAETAHGYWQGPFQFYFAWRAWVENFLIAAPETVLEPIALRWLPLLIAISGVLVIAAAWPGRKQHRWHRWFLLLAWLLLPALLFFAIAFRMPKFHPRYLLLSYPAWLLLLAGGFAAVWSTRGRRVSWPRGAVLAGLLVLLTANGYALHNWFTDPAFSKPDFRGALRYLQQHRQPDEPVILLSGHMRPVVTYYAPHLPVLPLPDERLLDVNKIIRPDVVRTLNQKVAGHPGAWLLLWQDDIADPNAIIAHLFATYGREEKVPAAFWGVRLRHYDLPPDVQFRLIPQHPLAIRFGGKIDLVGYSVGRGDHLTLFYRATRPVTGDVHLALRLLDSNGNVWGANDRRPAGYNYPTFRWQPGELLPGFITLPAAPGTPPGNYQLAVMLYDAASPHGWDAVGANGELLGKEIKLPVTLHRLRPAQVTDIPAAAQRLPSRQECGPVAYQLRPAQGAAGQRLHLETWWHAGKAPQPTDRYRWRLQAADGSSVEGPWVTFNALGENGWPANAYWRQQQFLRLPRRQSVTTWQLSILWQSGGADHEQKLADIPVLPEKHLFVLPPLERHLEAQFGGRLRLAGLNGWPRPLHRGDTMSLTLVWQAEREMTHSWTGFVHLLGPDGRVKAQDDHLLGGTGHSTDSWFAGEVITDTFRLTLPAKLPPGDQYRLEIGVYDAQEPGLPRLSRTDNSAAPGTTTITMPATILP